MINVFKELEKNFNYKVEIMELSKVFTAEEIYCNNYDTLENHFNERLFREWELNNGRLSVKSLEIDLGFRKQNDTVGFFCPKDEIDAIRYMQFLINVLDKISGNSNMMSYISVNKQTSFLIKKIKHIATKMSLKLIQDTDDGTFCFCPIDENVEAVAALQTEPEVSTRLFDYIATNSMGNLEKKKSILRFYANVLEPDIKAQIKKQGDIHELYNNIDFALNNFNIRHNNSDPKLVKYYNKCIAELNDSELEELYDITFNLIVNALGVCSAQKNIETFKKYRTQIKIDKKEE